MRALRPVLPAVLTLAVVAALATPSEARPSPSGGSSRPAAADRVPGGPSATFDLDSVSWYGYRDQTSSDFADTFDDRKADFIPIDLEIDTEGGYRVGSVWQRNTDGRSFREKRNLTGTEYKNYWEKARDDGFRLVEHETYLVNGTRLYAGIWIRNLEGLAWASKRGQTNAEFKETFADYRDAGLMPIDFDEYKTSDGMRYSTVWVARQTGGWLLYRNLTRSEWKQKFQENSGTFRVLSFESVRTSQGQRYGGIFVSNDNGRGWAFRRDMTARSYKNWWYRYRDLGLRQVGLDRYQTADGPRYASIWRQNNDRLAWSHRAEIDTLVQDRLDATEIPGVAVAVYQRGTPLYLRGFGMADKGDGIWMDSSHTGSIASVSKAVAGVLLLRMDELGQIDLADATRDWVPTMPTFHTHTVGQLAANRGCVRHYVDGLDGFVDKSYATALDAAEEFWDDALVCDPLVDVEDNYSTHGYTLLGAALEAAGDDDIKGLVRSRLVTPFHLGTLGPQRSTGHRMAIYNNSGDEIDAPDNDWKVLGGGLDSSVADLASFGDKLASGDILGRLALAQLWTPPDTASGYAYGWSTGTEQGQDVVWKNGSWTGNLAYLRLYPRLGLSIAVITNSRETSGFADRLGESIGAALLPAPPT